MAIVAHLKVTPALNDDRAITGVDDARLSTAIIIPAFNAAVTIGETLRSVQACPGLAKVGAIFVCDDASSDATAAEAMRAWSGSPKLTFWRNASNLGERSTVNAAFERLRGNFEWAFILHADDVVKENWIELYLDRVRGAGPKVASICSSYDCWYPKANRIDPGEDDSSRDLEIIRGGRESVLGTLKSGCWWHISGCAIRVEHFLQIGGFQPHMPQLGDFEWLLRCLKLGFDIEYIPRTTMRYRMHPSSVSSISFRRGQDLIERLEIFGTYCNEGYLPKQGFRAVRMRIAITALKRMLKQLAGGRIRGSKGLGSVCWRALSS
jgi:glycosyltransferase involved in cell wall biosynthesis